MTKMVKLSKTATGAVRALMSGAVVYTTVVACGAPEPYVRERASAGESTGGSQGSGGSSIAHFDAGTAGATGAAGTSLLSPVREAAAALPPDVATEDCSVTVAMAGSYTYHYAVHAYPGKSMTDLSVVRTITHATTFVRTAGWLPGYENTVGAPMIKDGEAAVCCGVTLTSDAGLYDARGADRVTFILPAAL